MLRCDIFQTLKHSKEKELILSSRLLAAIEAGDEYLVQTLLDQGDNVHGKMDCDAFSLGYAKSLVKAVTAGHESIARLLLDRGVRLFLKDHHNSLLLAETARKGYEGLVRILLDQSAPIINVWDGSSRDSLNGSLDGSLDGSLGGSSSVPLMESVLAGHQSVTRLPLNRGANVMATALSIKEHTGAKSMIRFLRNPTLQGAVAAQNSDFGDTSPLQYYEPRQRLQVLHQKFGEQNLKLKLATTQSLTSFQN